MDTRLPTILWNATRLASTLLLTGTASCSDDTRVNPAPAACYLLGPGDAVPCPALGTACSTPPGDKPAMSEPVQVVPSDRMPREVVSQVSHNNLDIIWFHDRLFFAFRTAPSHFASSDTRLYVASTTDLKTWRYETSFYLETDLREPRFLSFDGRLFLYFAVLGKRPLMFEPQGAKVSEYLGPCSWSEPRDVFVPGFIPWRMKTFGDRPYMMGYAGGEDIYGTGEAAIDVYWLTTSDGHDWEPVVPGKPVVLRGGTSETDFTFADDGAMIAVSRNEAGNGSDFGSRICRAEASDLGAWQCVSDPRKYDSPLVFRHKGKIWLLARRNVTETGNYDLGMDDLPHAEQYLHYQIEYWQTPKRCSLWIVDPVHLEVQFVKDLPSRGDTCFASTVPLKDDDYLIFNYTSPLGGPEISWNEGQNGPTVIYRLTLGL